MASPKSGPACAALQVPTLLLVADEADQDVPPPALATWPAHHQAPGAAPAPRSTEFAPFIVCAKTHVYHLAAVDSEGRNGPFSVCRQVMQNPMGGQYRSGRRRPHGTQSTRGYRCCSVCAQIAQAADEAELSRPAQVVSRLLAMAAGMSDDRLWSAASYQGSDQRKIAGRDAARTELDRRMRQQAAGKRVAA